MPRRKKFPRLPSGYGSIRYLGKGRALPYAVHPPCKERDSIGRYVRPAALCYVPDWYTGFAVLGAYHAGTYEKGLENTIHQEVTASAQDLDAFCRRVLKDAAVANPAAGAQKMTFADVYRAFFADKYGEHAAKKLSRQSEVSTNAAYNLLSALHGRDFDALRLPDLQQTVNEIGKSKSTVSNCVTLIKQMYRYAVPLELCGKDYGQYVKMPSAPEAEHHEAFTDAELAVLWKHKDDPVVAMVLVMCYSGFRVSAWMNMETNLPERYFRGGVKTAAGKNRVVPIHSAILPLVETMGGKYLCGVHPQTFRVRMETALKGLNLPVKTPHSCRHTFSRLCESYGVKEADRKRMMGHSFRDDITNGVYGHRTVEELRGQIEKIRLPDL